MDTPQACTSDADCSDGADDDFCAFNGFHVGFQVTGTNSADSGTGGVTDISGQISFNYPDTNGVGSDSIQGCLDLDDATESAAECLGEVGSDAGDIASTPVTKTWIAAISGTVVLSPTDAINPDNVNGAFVVTHTVTAQVTGVERCTGGGGNDGDICSDNSNCTGGDTCTDPSGVTVGFEIESGPNAGDKGWTTTDGSGVASLTYTSNGVAGVDSIRACLDADPLGSGNDEIDGLVSNCIADVGGEPDFASNTVTKRWDPTLVLKNFNPILNAFSTDPAYNPVGTSHTVQATIVGAANICSGTSTVCSSDADCGNVVGSCSLAGYPVFFGVVSGPNTGDIAGGSVLTDANGVATKNYTDTAGAGLDTIQACVDADLTDPIPDDADFTQCLAEYPGEADVPSNTVLKYWLSSFVTGGGKWTKPDKSWDSFGGTVGQKPKSTAFVGEWDETAHASKGGNVSCHWKTFTTLAFSCTNGPCGTTPDTVQFTASAGKCSGAPSQTVIVRIVDGRKKPDTIKVTGGSGLGSALNVNPPVALGTGNFTLHP